MTIDWWTLGIQTVNVVILVWLLGAVLLAAGRGMIERAARHGADRPWPTREAKRSQATAALAEIERTRAGFAQERDAILAAAHEAAERARAARLAEAAKEAAALDGGGEGGDREGARTRPTRPGPSARADLAVDIAERLAARLDGPAVRSRVSGLAR